MVSDRLDSRSLVSGGIAGVAAWILGYVFTYLLVAPDVRDRGFGRILEVLQGEPATYEMVGWVFYNAHLVQTVFADVPVLGTFSRTFVGGEGGYTPLLYVVPVALLLAAGLAMGRLLGARETGDGVLAGLTVLPGYLLASIAGALLFVVSVGRASIGPDLLPAIVVAGIAFPVLCAGAGGAVAAMTARS